MAELFATVALETLRDLLEETRFLYTSQPDAWFHDVDLRGDELNSYYARLRLIKLQHLLVDAEKLLQIYGVDRREKKNMS